MCYPVAEMSSADVGAHLLPIVFQELDASDESISKGAADMVDDSAVKQATEQLAVHALPAVWTEDRLNGAGAPDEPANVVLPELAALVVGRAGRLDWQAGRGQASREGEHEVHPLAASVPLIRMKMPRTMGCMHTDTSY